jgi:hypothetical protein
VRCIRWMHGMTQRLSSSAPHSMITKLPRNRVAIVAGRLHSFRDCTAFHREAPCVYRGGGDRKDRLITPPAASSANLGHGPNVGSFPRVT